MVVPCRLFAFDNENIANYNIPTVNDVDGKMICYRFGGYNIFTVIIKGGDSLCDVFISDLNGRCISTECEKTPILEWTFDNLFTILNDPDPTISECYYSHGLKELSLMIGGKRKRFRTYGTVKIPGNEKLEEKINELMSFIDKIWIIEFFSKYGLDSAKVYKNNH